MNTITRISLVGLAFAALGLFGPLALAQDAAADKPRVERPAVPAPPVPSPQVQAPQVERPQVTQPQVEKPDADARSDEPEMTWDRAPERRGARRGSSSGGHNDGLVSFGSSSTLNAGQRADAVVSIFGSSTSSGEVSEAIVSVLGSTRVEGGSVGDAAVSVIGDNYINAKVDGDVVAVLGNTELGPNADIRGNVVVIGGTLKRDPNAQVGGGVQHVMTLPAGALTGLRSWLDNCVRYLRPLAFAPGLTWAWTIALGFLGLYALLGLMFREPVDRCVKTLQDHPGQTILASLLAMILTPVLFVVLCITVIGIVFVPIASFGIFIASLFGKAVVLAWIGRSLLKFIDNGEKLNAAVAVLAGGAVMLVLYTVPVLGFIVYNLLGILAFGVVVYTLLLAAQARRKSSPPPANRVPGGAGPAAGGATFGANGPAYATGADPATGGAAGFAAAGDANANAAYGSAAGYGPGSSAGYAPGSTGGYPSGSSAGYAPGPASDAYANAAAGASAASAADASAAGASQAGASDASAGAGNAAGSGEPGVSTPGSHFGASGAAAGGAYTPPPNYLPPLNEAVTHPRAGFWIRMLALLIDTILISVAISALTHSGGKLFLVSLATYGAIMWKLKSTTVGGIVCNLKVVRIDGRPMDWPTAVIRALGCFLSLIVVGLGFIWIAFDDGRQSWHDKIAGTAVVRTPQGVSLL